jgi:hypothetical protein
VWHHVLFTTSSVLLVNDSQCIANASTSTGGCRPVGAHMCIPNARTYVYTCASSICPDREHKYQEMTTLLQCRARDITAWYILIAALYHPSNHANHSLCLHMSITKNDHVHLPGKNKCRIQSELTK